MPREKKESKPFNIRMEKTVYNRLVEFCEVSGQSKTLAVERAVMLYIEQNTSEHRESKWSGEELP